MNWGQSWENQPPAAHLMLSPLSALYALGWTAYLATYQLGLKKPYRASIPVICVGNLTVGGTGKTPLTMHLVEVLRRLGREVVISCSGYGSPHSAAAEIAPEGRLSAAEWGDEAALFREEIADCPPLIVGRRRVLAAQLAEQHFPNAVLLMDDGFQHLPLYKDISLTIDQDRRNRMCLPAGPYREMRSAGRRRATLVLPSEFEVVRTLRLGEAGGTPAVQEVDLLCAIGQPMGFMRALEGAGFTIGKAKFLPDHDPLTAGNLLAGLGEARPLVVTSKDWVKLRERNDLGNKQIVVASSSCVVEPAQEFAAWLEKHLNEADAARNRK
ncbi:MAG: tetraacyldisaccharide 4'-kinase [Fimbriimonadaceae bacterium]|nr:tetraacyldisaccharide 4'-kinase [Fimbriimonadaceae bacterium]